MKLHLVFVETALELVPPEILRHPSVRRNAKRRGKRPEETLLDRSLHHFAMDRLPDSEKRGRPDIIHFCLLEALGSPLNREGGLRTWVHTIGGYAIEVSPKVRLPRDCNRFNSLMEQLFAMGRVPPEGGEPLLSVSHMDLRALMGRIGSTYTVALTSHGTLRTLEDLCRRLAEEEQPTALIGAYPHGPMELEVLSVANEAISIHPEALEAWTVTSRLIYEFERSIQFSAGT